MNINTLDLTADEAKAILADGSLIMASREEVEQGEAAISERDILRSKVAALEAELAEARKDLKRMDHLEGEMAYEKYCIEHGLPIPSSLFRRNVPITRAAIDAARGTR